MPLALHKRLTVSDYLAAEEASPARHEFVGGEVHAMTGGTARHNRICGNAFLVLCRRFAGTPCQVFISDMKLHVARVDAVYYPDVFVHCGPAAAGNERMFDDATVIVEVLSDSTASIDRREKLAAYRQLPGLRAYLLVAQEEQAVEVHARDAAGNWTATRWLAGETLADDVVGPLVVSELYVGTDLA
jgi:Uma2 family endonuclease